MFAILPSNLRTQVVLPVIVGLALLVAGFGYAGFRTVRESTDRTLQERLTIAKVTADRVDDVLGGMAQLLDALVANASIDPEHPDSEANREAMRFLFSHLGDMALYVGLVNTDGVKVWTEPYRAGIVGLDLSSSPDIQRVLAGEGPIITRVFSFGDYAPSAAILIGIKDADGNTRGALCIDLDLEQSRFASLLQPAGLGVDGYAELVDQNGVVVATTRPERLWQNVDRAGHFADLIQSGQTMVGRCHECHEGALIERPAEEIVAFAPLSSAPWGVAIRQPRSVAMAYTSSLANRSLAVGSTALAVSLLVMFLVSRRLVSPMQTLASACKEITAGDLDRPIPLVGNSELDECARCFEDLRFRLRASVAEIERWNQELEQKVSQRTEELAAAERARGELLRKLVVAQEEERKRLARELHDETSQSVTALMVGLETTLRSPADTPDQVKDQVAAIKPRVQELLEDVNRIILDLRPSILDDLGLVQAIDWYAESRLRSLDVAVHVWTVGFEQRFASEVETMVFRIAQEAITNIIRHAHPHNVNIGLSFRETHTLLVIEDDGAGFDSHEADHNGDGRLHYGLLGMKERAALFGGDLKISSRPGRGTRISLEIPHNGVDE